MTVTTDEFGTVLEEWKNEQAYPWGRLMYGISHLNIQRHLKDQRLRILDVGGGNGKDSLFFARLGHSVTLMDCSSAMLADALKTAQEQGTAERITIRQGDAGAIEDLFAGQRFDLILCHLMIEFVADPDALLRGICNLLSPGGLLSVIGSNRYSLPYRIAFQTNALSKAAQEIGSRNYFHPWVKRLTPQFSAQEIIGRLRGNGCKLAGHYGIRCICDYLPNEPKFEPRTYAELEQLEQALTDTYPYYLLARFYQVIARKE